MAPALLLSTVRDARVASYLEPAISSALALPLSTPIDRRFLGRRDAASAS
jgi:hypothetical protein